jgi:hypothetical protein
MLVWLIEMVCALPVFAQFAEVSLRRSKRKANKAVHLLEKSAINMMI